MKIQSPVRRAAAPAGFTLIEIMLVVGIIVILMGAVLSRMGGFGDTAKIAATDAKISQLSAAISSYQTNGGSVPSTEQGLKALVQKPGGRPVPTRWVKLANDSDLVDGWKVPLAYYSPARKGGGEFEIVSAGPDKKMNTDDDISSVKPE